MILNLHSFSRLYKCWAILRMQFFMSICNKIIFSHFVILTGEPWESMGIQMDSNPWGDKVLGNEDEWDIALLSQSAMARRSLHLLPISRTLNLIGLHEAAIWERRNFAKYEQRSRLHLRIRTIFTITHNITSSTVLQQCSIVNKIITTQYEETSKRSCGTEKCRCCKELLRSLAGGLLGE